MLKNPDVKNANKSKYRLTPVKLQSKKQDKKALDSREKKSKEQNFFLSQLLIRGMPGRKIYTFKFSLFYSQCIFFIDY